MRTLYLAGPMTGYPDFNYPAFNEAAERLREAGYEVLNPVDNEAENDTGAPQAWGWYLRRALKQVVDAEGVALLPGSQNSRGARLEKHVAEGLGMPVHSVEEWLVLAHAAVAT